jgi:hypothetical protein
LRPCFIDVPEPQKERELAFLQAEIYRRQVDVPVTRIAAYSRFFGRV